MGRTYIGLSAVALMVSLFGVALLLLRSSPSSTAGADEAVTAACARMEAVDSYAISGTIRLHGQQGSDSWDETLIVSAKVNGQDYHVSFTVQDQPDMSLEFKRVGGQGYERRSETGNSWKITEYPLGHIDVSLLEGLGEDPICPETSDFRDLGSTTVNGESIQRFTDAPEDSTRIEDGQSPGATNEVWVNDSGQLVQLKQTVSESRNIDGVAARSDTDAQVSFANVGKSITITAPTVGE